MPGLSWLMILRPSMPRLDMISLKYLLFWRRFGVGMGDFSLLGGLIWENSSLVLFVAKGLVFKCIYEQKI